MAAGRLLARRTGRGCRRWCERSSGDVFELRRDRYASTVCASKNLKVAIVGATGQTGRSLALCLKQSALIDELAVYDSHPTRGLLLELSHMDSRCRTIVEDEASTTSACNGKRDLERALTGAKIVAITLDGESIREEAEYLEKILSGLLGCCPKALVALVSRRVNSLVPMLYELYKRAGLFEASSRIFGVVSLFATRANGLAAETLKIQPELSSVPVIGGGCPRSCVPLFSQTRPCADFTPEELSRLSEAMKSAEAAESSSLCLGFAAARFCISLCKAARRVHTCTKDETLAAARGRDRIFP
ncbi:malate dehydrogenase 2, peroxisomal isoform X3 [Nasonia vitripennis]|uniref:Malate dehydrogenase, mitochondrial n=1 Tax=Nasonia vitripennis TaxID=7425 RepID=A0A7M7Q802_NASVI|nr:malate dehydrogenase 2, peroxisomal isoform X3 [Nasonia vitripennis]